MPRRSLTISAIRVTGKRKSMAIVHTQAERGHELLVENLAWMYRFEFLRHAVLLVVVHNLDFIGVSIPPRKADAPLIVDADAVLTFAIPLQALQTASLHGRKHSDVWRRRIQHGTPSLAAPVRAEGGLASPWMLVTGCGLEFDSNRYGKKCYPYCKGGRERMTRSSTI